MKPIALGWIDYDRSTAPDWDAAQVQRLARRLGYRLVWPEIFSPLPLADQARGARAEMVILPAPDHVDPLALDGLMHIVDVETVHPRLSFARWSIAGGLA
ncbi:hypothetical protein [Nocardia cyriacigeorgica]|uniref:hypothetical protein n=1 Tax=Nocardia cyriacigeorgica TaxID=135487 RepID=UPI001895C2D3|nr:hypothetical protein [Nocardia cyriacigeorgica]MBF6455744.1 hypothetical protein [Nocardia cyriacigeorgica]MBF6479813.1 hypothetical protein [Nocardia cyriacigeorgica]MBF6553514.1 hypothetical protein [Nocardia cyriacigeorgica]